MDKAKLLKRLLLAHPIVKYHYGELEKAYKQPSTIPKTMAESAPITGELMSAYQAYDSSGKARNAFAKDKKGEGAGHAVNAILGLAGAIPGLGMIARATKRGKRVTDAMLPKGVNAFIDGITPNVKDARRTMQIFVGPKSATANHVALSRAQEMERQGINRSEIWQATGWGRGRDGQWRYEIDDSGARMVDPFGNAQTTDRHLAADVSRGHGPHQPMHLDDFITHPEFTRAMGEKTPRVFFDDMPIGSGYYFPKHDTITQGNGNFLMGDGGKGVALHEMQHAAQWRNDFDIGGAPKTAKQHAQWRLRKDALEIGQDAQRHTDLQRQLEAASAAEHLAKLNRLAKAERIRPSQVTNLMDFYENSHLIRARFGAMPKQGGAARDEWLRNAASFMYNRFAAHLDKTLPVQQSSLVKGLVSDPAAAKNMQARLVREMQKTLPASRKMNEIGRQYAKIDKLDDYSAYKRLAGEVEARNVQTRADFSADERRRVPPWRTQDIPDEDQILGTAARFYKK